MQIYAYRREVVFPQTPDLTDFEVEATDGSIGKIDAATYETGNSCLVVDTGFWIFGKKRMIPAGLVSDVDWNEKKVFVGMTKDEIKQAPDYDHERHQRDEDAYHKEVGEYYDPWTTEL